MPHLRLPSEIGAEALASNQTPEHAQELVREYMQQLHHFLQTPQGQKVSAPLRKLIAQDLATRWDPMIQQATTAKTAPEGNKPGWAGAAQAFSHGVKGSALGGALDVLGNALAGQLPAPDTYQPHGLGQQAAYLAGNLIPDAPLFAVPGSDVLKGGEAATGLAKLGQAALKATPFASQAGLQQVAQDIGSTGQFNLPHEALSATAGELGGTALHGIAPTGKDLLRTALRQGARIGAVTATNAGAQIAQGHIPSAQEFGRNFLRNAGFMVASEYAHPLWHYLTAGAEDVNPVSKGTQTTIDKIAKERGIPHDDAIRHLAGLSEEELQKTGINRRDAEALKKAVKVADAKKAQAAAAAAGPLRPANSYVPREAPGEATAAMLEAPTAGAPENSVAPPGQVHVAVPGTIPSDASALAQIRSRIAARFPTQQPTTSPRSVADLAQAPQAQTAFSPVPQAFSSPRIPGEIPEETALPPQETLQLPTGQPVQGIPTPTSADALRETFQGQIPRLDMVLASLSPATREVIARGMKSANLSASDALRYVAKWAVQDPKVVLALGIPENDLHTLQKLGIRLAPFERTATVPSPAAGKSTVPSAPQFPKYVEKLLSEQQEKKPGLTREKAIIQLAEKSNKALAAARLSDRAIKQIKAEAKRLKSPFEQAPVAPGQATKGHDLYLTAMGMPQDLLEKSMLEGTKKVKNALSDLKTEGIPMVRNAAKEFAQDFSDSLARTRELLTGHGVTDATLRAAGEHVMEPADTFAAANSAKHAIAAKWVRYITHGLTPEQRDLLGAAVLHERRMTMLEEGASKNLRIPGLTPAQEHELATDPKLIAAWQRLIELSMDIENMRREAGQGEDLAPRRNGMFLNLSALDSPQAFKHAVRPLVYRDEANPAIAHPGMITLPKAIEDKITALQTATPGLTRDEAINQLAEQTDADLTSAGVSKRDIQALRKEAEALQGTEQTGPVDRRTLQHELQGARQVKSVHHGEATGMAHAYEGDLAKQIENAFSEVYPEYQHQRFLEALQNTGYAVPLSEGINTNEHVFKIRATPGGPEVARKLPAVRLPVRAPEPDQNGVMRVGKKQQGHTLVVPQDIAHDYQLIDTPRSNSAAARLNRKIQGTAAMLHLRFTNAGPIHISRLLDRIRAIPAPEDLKGQVLKAITPVVRSAGKWASAQHLAGPLTAEDHDMMRRLLINRGGGRMGSFEGQDLGKHAQNWQHAWFFGDPAVIPEELLDKVPPRLRPLIENSWGAEIRARLAFMKQAKKLNPDLTDTQLVVLARSLGNNIHELQGKNLRRLRNLDVFGGFQGPEMAREFKLMLGLHGIPLPEHMTPTEKALTYVYTAYQTSVGDLLHAMVWSYLTTGHVLGIGLHKDDARVAGLQPGNLRIMPRSYTENPANHATFVERALSYLNPTNHPIDISNSTNNSMTARGEKLVGMHALSVGAGESTPANAAVSAGKQLVADWGNEALGMTTPYSWPITAALGVHNYLQKDPVTGQIIQPRTNGLGFGDATRQFVGLPYKAPAESWPEYLTRTALARGAGIYTSTGKTPGQELTIRQEAARTLGRQLAQYAISHRQTLVDLNRAIVRAKLDPDVQQDAVAAAHTAWTRALKAGKLR